jgi:hypothetical protein
VLTKHNLYIGRQRSAVRLGRFFERGLKVRFNADADAGGEMRAQVVARAWQELMQWRTKYGEYRELARIAQAIDREDEARKQ